MYCLFTWMSKWMEKHCLEVMFVQSKEQPGEFRWQPGSVTQDICNGFWVVVEDVDKASPDVQSILLPLLEGASSFITGHGEVVITLAELLCDQLKAQQKFTSRSLHKQQQPFDTRSMDDLIAFLDQHHLEDSDSFICVLVHNIDGPGLRDPDTQQYLARIAACSNIRVVASIDHVNALLLWDKKMVHTQFNWYWHHVPTFAPYKVEGMFLPLILAQGGSSQNVKTASIVLQSLTPNAQSVFKVLAEHQLANPDEEGMPVNNLYATCRERFLVSSQITLNSHLTEFKDHDLVKTRRDTEGQDCLYIPIPNEALEKIIKDTSQ